MSYPPSVWYSYAASGRLVSFVGPSFFPEYDVFVSYDDPFPFPGGPVAQLATTTNGIKSFNRTGYFIDANDDAYKIIRGRYYMGTDENTYHFTYSNVVNPERAFFRTSLIAEYPQPSRPQRGEPELISYHLPATSASQYNAGPIEPAVIYAYDRDHLGRVVRAYIVKNGTKLLIKEYEY